MKLRTRSKIAIILAVSLSLYFSIFVILEINLNMSKNDADSLFKDECFFGYDNQKIQSESGKDHIDSNWTAVKGAGICTGDGTYLEPYVIEDLVMYSVLITMGTTHVL